MHGNENQVLKRSRLFLVCKTFFDVCKNNLKHCLNFLEPMFTSNILTLSLPECLMEFCKVTLTFESVDEIL